MNADQKPGAQPRKPPDSVEDRPESQDGERLDDQAAPIAADAVRDLLSEIVASALASVVDRAVRANLSKMLVAELVKDTVYGEMSEENEPNRARPLLSNLQVGGVSVHVRSDFDAFIDGLSSMLDLFPDLVESLADVGTSNDDVVEYGTAERRKLEAARAELNRRLAG